MAAIIGLPIAILRLGIIRTLPIQTWKNVLYQKRSFSWQTRLYKEPCTQCRLLHNTAVLSKRRKTAEEKKSKNLVQYSPKAKVKLSVADIWKNMTVADVANSLGKDVDHVFEVMMYVDNSVNYTKPTSVIDNMQVIKDIVKRSGMKFKIVPPPGEEDSKTVDKDVYPRPPPDPADMVKRPPVVTIMGHVDHGKTTLLDSLRHTSVVETEFGGITQHIGAFSVKLENGDTITFLDTPGHAAFSAMRERGAQATDIVVLVVAADDGVMEQTVESIRMAKEAQVPIIVAINKIDKPEADIEMTKTMLMTHGIQVEDRGGEVQVVPISALKGTNLDLLTESIVLQAELMELKGDPYGMVEGIVIESKTDPMRGKLSTALVQRGTLRKGTVMVAGVAWAKVRAMFNEHGQPIQEAPPSTPVEVLGWRELPSAGDIILEVESEKRAHEVIRWREAQKKAEKQQMDYEAITKKTEEHLKSYKAQLQMKRLMGRFRLKPSGPREKEIKEDNFPRVSIIVKGDVDGSVEAILDVLETYDGSAVCKLDVVHYGVGMVTESDIDLAESFNAIIYTFNTDVSPKVKQLAKTKNIEIRPHNVIYKLVDDLKKEISAQLPLKEVEEEIGAANVLQHFDITEGKKKVPVAGCRCVKGVLKKSERIRLIRGEDVIYDGKLLSLKHLKAEVDTIKKDVECGVRIDADDIKFQQGDTFICYTINKVEQQTEWDPGF